MIEVDEYAIISISDDRLEHKDAIDMRAGFKKATGISFVEGLTADIEALKKEFGIRHIWPEAKYGEVGVWFSMLNICKYSVENNKTVLALEDDATIYVDNLKTALTFPLSETPDDADAFSVIVPDNQMVLGNIEWLNKAAGLGITHGDIAPTYKIPNAHSVCRAYQGYCLVGMIYTPRGALRILDLVKTYGLTTPADCWLFEMNDSNDLDIYTLVPSHHPLIGINWTNQEKTTVHDTGRISDANL